MTRAAIELHIETLVLEGLPATSGEAVRAAVEQELSRLIVDRGVPQPPAEASASLDHERIDGGTLPVAQRSGIPALATGIGRHVATSVYRGLGR